MLTTVRLFPGKQGHELDHHSDFDRFVPAYAQPPSQTRSHILPGKLLKVQRSAQDTGRNCHSQNESLHKSGVVPATKPSTGSPRTPQWLAVHRPPIEETGTVGHAALTHYKRSWLPS